MIDKTYEDINENRETEELPEPQPEKTSTFRIDDSIPDEVKPLIKSFPEQDQKRIERIVALSLRLWKGPIPPPDILKEYNEAVPNGADRILTMAENQSQHRIGIEKTVINRELNQSGKGQNYGFIIAIFVLLSSSILIYLGHDIAGTVLGGIDLVGLVYVFVVGKRAQQKDLEHKK